MKERLISCPKHGACRTSEPECPDCLQDVLLTKQLWISVKEKLPERDERVLFWYVNPNNPKESGYDIGRFRLDGFSGIFTYKAEAVTHWMPLPEPPKK